MALAISNMHHRITRQQHLAHHVTTQHDERLSRVHRLVHQAAGQRMEERSATRSLGRARRGQERRHDTREHDRWQMEDAVKLTRRNRDFASQNEITHKSSIQVLHKQTRARKAHHVG